MSNPVIIQGIVVLVGVLIYHLFFGKKSGFPLPPGPKPLPIVGNIRDGPASGEPDFLHWLTFKDKYGPISSVTVLGLTMVLVHDKDAITELLEKKASKTSGRPSFKLANLSGYDRYFGFRQNDEQFRLHRKLVAQQIGSKILVSQYTDIQDVIIKRFLLQVLNDPDHLFNHIRSKAASVILNLFYGYSTELYKPDNLVKLIEEVMGFLSDNMVPFKWAVDLIPALVYLPKWFPGAGFKRLAHEARSKLEASVNLPFDFVKQQMATGIYQESYCSKLINTFKNGGEGIGEDNENDIKWTAAHMFTAGSDTTVSTLITFTLAMITNPDVQRKAQEEINRVVGPDRLPTAADQENLPYVNAIIKESFRYFPVAPMGVAHKTSEEISFRGYRIPNGSYIIPAIWWFLHDPETYPEPSKFIPERFLEPRNEPNPEIVFGYGRRACPGRFVAQESLYLAISRLLAAFNIGKATCVKGGKPVEVEWKHRPGMVDSPAEFSYSIVPRSEKYAELVRRVEVDHPWEGSSEKYLQQNSTFDKFKEKLEREAKGSNY